MESRLIYFISVNYKCKLYCKVKISNKCQCFNDILDDDTFKIPNRFHIIYESVKARRILLVQFVAVEGMPNLIQCLNASKLTFFGTSCIVTRSEKIPIFGDIN